MESTLIHRPRLYELTASLAFRGRRRRTYDRLVAASGARPGDRVLDVGCGTGYLTRRAAAAVAPDGAVVGVDPSAPVVAYARRRLPTGGFHVAGAESVPEASASFDVVVSSLAIHHIAAQRRAVAFDEMHRLLRPGGRLLIAEIRPGGFGHAARHSVGLDLGALITAAGFEVLGTGTAGRSLHYVAARRP